MKIAALLPSLGALAAVAFAGLVLPRHALADDILFQLIPGETATLELDGNASTGYSWELREPSSGVGTIVEVDILGYAAPQPQPGERSLVGAPQKFQVQLTGIDAGRASLVFDYVRPGEPEPEKTQAYQIEVLGGNGI